MKIDHCFLLLKTVEAGNVMGVLMLLHSLSSESFVRELSHIFPVVHVNSTFSCLRVLISNL